MPKALGEEPGFLTTSLVRTGAIRHSKEPSGIVDSRENGGGYDRTLIERTKSFLRPVAVWIDGE